MILSNANDTIAAIATPNGRGGVGIVRISGSKALAIAQALVLDQQPLKARYAHFRRFYSADQSILDEGLALYFPTLILLRVKMWLSCKGMVAWC